MYHNPSLGIYTVCIYKIRGWWNEWILSPRAYITQKCQNWLVPPVPPTPPPHKMLWGGWDLVGISPSLGFMESRITLRVSMWLAGRCVKFCRKYQGGYWAYSWSRCIQGSWKFWSSPQPFQLPPGGWLNTPDFPVGATTMRWSCSTCRWFSP